MEVMMVKVMVVNAMVMADVGESEGDDWWRRW